MLQAENKVNVYKHNYHWSPELHIAIKTVTIWKLTLTQLKKYRSFHTKK